MKAAKVHVHCKRARSFALSHSGETPFGGFSLHTYFIFNVFSLKSKITTLAQRRAKTKHISLKNIRRFIGVPPKGRQFLKFWLPGKILRKQSRVFHQEAAPNDLNTDISNNRNLQLKEETVQALHNDERKKSFVILKSHQRKPSSSVQQKCFAALSLMGRCNLLSKGRRLIFMMHKKLSLFTIYGRLQFLKLRRSSRNCKALEPKKPRYRRDFWSRCRRSFRDKFHKTVSYLKSKLLRPAQDISRPSDMNNNTLGILCEKQQCTTNSCLRDETVNLQNIDGQIVNVSCKPVLKISQHQLHGPVATWESESSVSRQINDIPAAAGYPDDVYILVTEKEVSVSCQEDTNTQGGEGDELMHMAPDKLQLSINDHTGCQATTPVEMLENCDDSSHMDVEESSNMGVFNTKLLDHPYCKSPPQDTQDCPPEETLQMLAKDGVKNGQNVISSVSDEQLASFICGLLDDIIKKYGSLIPLSEKDMLTCLKEAFNEDFSNRISFISKEITKYRAKHSKAPTCNFRVFYNKHMLDMDDLATLDGQNWLNDQVINMYGELIMDAVPDKVDFFKKSLLLIPIHLEVHWSLITVNIPQKIISFYDSQGIHFKFCVENIRKYLLTEAREKNHPEFLQDWQTAITKCIPQQKNDSDCGVFVLQYCKCLALDQPFQFSQEDMPRVRKRIYKELCERRLMD
ncbi:sentrin-specific protease 5 isoform X2 [Xenopus laevis]|uniref:Sentrin-specific protease 5 isoform X2 n=1 Tax=Xenopus laevis TaxID=8355 RepID=A0A8J0VG15_XENLA|nr:sentrin-specific protease 5 isoform X2 [Xenopus laevis]